MSFYLSRAILPLNCFSNYAKIQISCYNFVFDDFSSSFLGEGMRLVDWVGNNLVEEKQANEY